MDRRSPWQDATRDLPAPLAVVDLDAFEANAADLLRRAAGTPIRIASKSVRVPELVSRALALPGVAGVMGFSLPEAIWLVRAGITDDVLMGYPTVDETHLRELLADPALRAGITLMIDDVAHVRQLARLAAQVGADMGGTSGVQVCLDVDASLRIGPIHVGTRRSPLREPAQVAVLATAAAAAGLTVRGLMFYEAQVAGLNEAGLLGPVVRAMKRVSMAELYDRRTAVIAAVEAAVGPITLVNGGGSGSVAESAAAPGVTEVTAGSGLFVPTLFDHYASFTPRPAAFFALDIVRRPAPGYATAYGGGYIASGTPGPDRVPTPDRGTFLGAEGAGEVQTPLKFPPGREPQIGDRVWLRHAKSGELMEHFAHVHLIRGSEIEQTAPTYRGEGLPFG